jgi:exopolysaccharide biosynthesis polyprenyl glycosylphosphotransferase
MPGSIQRSFRNTEMLVDLGLLVIAFESAHFFRYMLSSLVPNIPPIADIDDFAWVLFFLIPTSVVVLSQSQLYQCSQRRAELPYFESLIKSLTTITVVLMAFLYVVKASDIARGVTILFFPFALAILGTKFLTRPTWQQWLTKLKWDELAFLIVAAKEDVPRIQDEVRQLMHVPPVFVGEVTQENHLTKRIEEILDQRNVDCVLVSSVKLPFLEVQEVVNACEREGVEVWVVTDFIRTSIARAEFDELAGRPLLIFKSTPGDSWQILVKRLVDLAVSLVALILLIPVFICITIAIRLDSPGPALFTQLRSGRRGRTFTMLKFRSMVTNAAMRQDELQTFNIMSGPVFKVENDPRITKVGKFLRRTSLDELPQLWNVLLGDMSLVGPRPLPVYETERFENLAHRRRLSVKPGITGLWQIRGRNEVKQFEDWVNLDLEYIDNWSIWLDLKILLETIPIVLQGLGAK